MFLKKNKVLGKFNKQKTKDKTILSKHVYNKFVVRSHLMGNKNFRVLDNNSHFYNISTYDLKKVSVYSKTDERGVSLNANLTEYNNKFNNSLRFKSFDFNNKVKSFSVLNSFKNLLEVVTNESSSSLIFLNPIKGGFTCYSSGVIGFLPRKQADFLISIASNSFESGFSKNSFLTDINYFLNDKNFIKNFFGIKLPHWWGRTGAYFSFSGQKLSTKLSFIFLSQKVFNLNKTSNKK
jgi:hypothetical protein